MIYPDFIEYILLVSIKCRNIQDVKPYDITFTGIVLLVK